jgi:hypothetical protein
MTFHRLLALLVVVLTCLGTASAQMLSMETVDGKQIICMHTGLWTGLADCGGNIASYAYVFVGSISKITPVKNEEMEIQIVPEEIFHGNPASPLIVVTQQGLCMPKMRVGDRWIFYL